MWVSSTHTYLSFGKLYCAVSAPKHDGGMYLAGPGPIVGPPVVPGIACGWNSLWGMGARGERLRWGTLAAGSGGLTWMCRSGMLW